MFAEALRLLRTREGLTQTAASKREGAPDFRTLSQWETKRKKPSLVLLRRYLTTMDRRRSPLNLPAGGLLLATPVRRDGP